MRRFFLIASVVALAGTAQAAPLTLSGNYLRVGISDFGTFGSNGSTSPGLLHDPTGMASFGVNDYLTPGTPHDGFAVTSTQYGWGGYTVSSNDNAFGGPFATVSGPSVLVGAAALGYANAAAWTGTGRGVTVTNSYFFNANDERIRVITEITANEALNNVLFGRSVDPDPDVNTFGSFATTNTRGDSLSAPSEVVSSAGPSTGLTLALLNGSGNTYAHNTGLGPAGGLPGCCTNDDPAAVLVGYGPTFPTTNFDDSSLQMAWNLGDFASGQTKSVEYYYVFGDRQDVISEPVPEPATLALLGVALAGLGAARRRRG